MPSNAIIEAIKSRRSARILKQDVVPSKDLIESVIDAATWAPNHHMTEPWRFIIITGDQRLRLGESLAKALQSDLRQHEQPKEEVLKVEREKPLRAPVVIAVISSPKEGERIVQQEEIVAGGAALQNMLLAAHSLGLGAMIKTGTHAYLEPMSVYLGLKEKESLIGFVYLGYPAEPPRPSKRSPLESKIEWRS